MYVTWILILEKVYNDFVESNSNKTDIGKSLFLIKKLKFALLVATNALDLSSKGLIINGERNDDCERDGDYV